MSPTDSSEEAELFIQLGSCRDSRNILKESQQRLSGKLYQTAIDYINAGKYSEAVSIFSQLGDYGDSQSHLGKALYNLGVQYRDGKGVSKNDAESVSWFKRASQQGHAKAREYLVKIGEMRTLDCGNGVKLELAKIPAGTFVMGSPPAERDRDNDEVQHLVTISRPFYMGFHQVTQARYHAVMGANPSRYSDSNFSNANHPVENVSWNDAMEFCDRLSKKTGKKVRLPTEAEWEYACRAGTTTVFNTGDVLKPDQANFNASRKGQTTPVGSYPENALGLFDMHGNVWEWCSDWYGKYAEGAVSDPKGPVNGTYRVLRGGSWFFDPGICRSACRGRAYA